MRWFFYLLLTSNILYMGTRMISVEDNSQRVHKTGIITPGPRLVLIAEASLPERNTPAVETVKSQESVQTVAIQSDSPVQLSGKSENDDKTKESKINSTLSCIKLSNIDSPKMQEKVSALIGRHDGRVTGSGKEQATKINYWVMFPPAKNRREALMSIDKLKEKGVKDFYLVRDGDNNNAISLGVFSSQNSVKRRQREIAGLRIGIKPKVLELELPAERYWITAIFNGQDLPNSDILNKSYNGLRVSPIKCEN